MALGATPELVPVDVIRVLKDCSAHNLWPLYLWGDIGVGKTYAAAVAYSLWRQTAWWIPLMELCEVLNGFNLSEFRMVPTAVGMVHLTRERMWHRFSEMGLVVLDELGTRKASDHRYDALLKMLDVRKGKPLILTGNIEPGELLAEIYDERVQSRIAAGVMVHMTGGDRRMESLETRIKEV